jgi:hypothetical protein
MESNSDSDVSESNEKSKFRTISLANWGFWS